MEVLYLHQHFSNPRGAAGIRSYEMARRAIHHGHTVTMVCGSYSAGNTGLAGPFVRGRREGVVDGIRVIEFELSYSNRDGFLKRSWTFLKFALGSVGIALRGRYDVLFATSTPLTAGIPGIFARWLRRKPFVFEVRDLWPELPRAMGVIRNPVVLGAMSALEYASYRSAHRCVALAPGIAEGIAQRGVAPERIVMVPNGCDIGIFGARSTQPWRPEGVSPHDLMAIYAGTHGQANGLDAVLNAAAVLQSRQRADIKIVLAGDGGQKPRLARRVADEGLSNIVLLPPMPKERLAGLMAAADLGLQCLANVPAFYYGTSPNKFFDYIAAGRPVLINYPGWVAEMIEKHDCGFVAPPDDPAALADALETAASDRAALLTKGRNAAHLARSEFDRLELADRWVAWVAEGRRLASPVVETQQQG